MAKAGDYKATLKEMEEIIEAQKAFENEMSRSFSSLFNGLKKEKAIRKDIVTIERELNKIQEIINKREKNGIKLTKEELKYYESKRKSLQKINKESEIFLKYLTKEKVLSKVLTKEFEKGAVALGKSLINLKDIVIFMDEQDGYIRALNQQLGISNHLSGSFGTSIINAAQHVARLGITTENLVEIQREYVNETGRLIQLNQQSFKDISAIAAGTGMGATNAAKMVGEFTNLGISIGQSKTLIEETIHEAQNYGISSGSLLNKVGKNLDKLNKYNFKNGVKGLIDMTKYSERFKIDMEGTFAAMDKSRTLEGSIDMAAKLMVMGGKFAEADPFKLMFLARNDPAKFTQELNKMTEGIAVYSKSTKQFEIGAYDLDRLRVVAEATGQDYAELSKQAKIFASQKMAKSQIFGVSNKEDKEMIASMATLKKDGNGGFEISVNGQMKDLKNLTIEDVKRLKQQKLTLEQWAESSQNFSQTFQNLVLELKATFLPFLESTKGILEKLRSTIQWLRETFDGTGMKWAAGLTVAVGTLSALGIGVGTFLTAGALINKGLGNLKNMGDITGGVGGGKAARDAATGRFMSNKKNPANDMVSGSGASKVGTAANYSRAASIAAVGIAAVGIGYGIKIMTDGFSNLAKTMKNLDIETQNRLLGTMAITVLGFGAAMGAAGFAAAAGWEGLLAASVTALAIGGSIAIAYDAMAGYNLAMAEYNKAATQYNRTTNSQVLVADAIRGINFEPMKLAFQEANKFVTADISNINTMKTALQSFEAPIVKALKDFTTKFGNGIEVNFGKGQEAALYITNHIEIDGETIVKKNVKKIYATMSDYKRGRTS